jgi:hypothetical protein
MGRSEGAAPYRVKAVAPGGASVGISSVLGLLTQPLPPTDSAPATLRPRRRAGRRTPVPVDWLRDRARRAPGQVGVHRRLLLAEAGVLNRRAVTHRSVCADLARRVPR